ncbi:MULTISPECIES: HlyD family secretion protein [unclassified Methylobacterium]|uniref:HlyD family secretion protein n=1 Tax=unclassified Methylobacterium TaxID=2615210 RepID=UPI001354FD33|nr:HlyD family secretion protein [Methylobacterium sp. 2A]MWV24972.1 HlyD family secretion protein [Methylobacterium sp. 2A]
MARAEEDESRAPAGGAEPQEDSASDAGRSEGGERSGEDRKPSALKKPWVKGLLAIAGIAVLVGGGIWGWHYWTVGRFIQETNDAYVQADQVAISPQVSGYLATVPVAANQIVAAGQVLVTVDDGQYRAKLAQQQAQVDARQADLARAEAEVVRQQAQIDQAKAQLAASQVTAKFSAEQVKRYKPLAASGADTVEKLDQYKSQAEQNQAQVEVNDAQVQSAQKQVASLKAAVAQAKAAVDQARAGVAQAQLDLDHTVVRSPIAGRVGDLTARIGQYVQASTRLMAVVPVEDLYIEANFKETQIGLMRVGQPVTVSVDALSGHDLKGRVASFSPGTGAQFALIPPENATGNFTKIVQRVPVRIRFKAGSEARKVLIPGLSVVVSVDTRGARDDGDGEDEDADEPKVSEAGPGAQPVERTRSARARP